MILTWIFDPLCTYIAAVIHVRFIQIVFIRSRCEVSVHGGDNGRINKCACVWTETTTAAYNSLRIPAFLPYGRRRRRRRPFKMHLPPNPLENICFWTSAGWDLRRRAAFSALTPVQVLMARWMRRYKAQGTRARSWPGDKLLYYNNTPDQVPQVSPPTAGGCSGCGRQTWEWLIIWLGG